MKKLFAVTLVAIMSSMYGMANQLDDVFAKISSIEGIIVTDIPSEDCAKEGIDSGKILMLNPEYIDDVAEIVDELDSALSILSVNNGSDKVNAWLIAESDDDATLLLTAFSSDGGTAVLMKGPKAVVSDIEMPE